MRDPTVDAGTVAASEEARRLLGLFFRLQRNSVRSEPEANSDADPDIGEQSIIELNMHAAGYGRLSPDVLDYLRRLHLDHREQPGRKRKRKRGRPFNTARDRAIATVIANILEHHRIPPTRSQSVRPSACSIVAAELSKIGIVTLSEKAVEKIWDKFRPKQIPVNPVN